MARSPRPAAPAAEPPRDDGIPDFLDRRASKKPQQANGATEATFVDFVEGGANG